MAEETKTRNSNIIWLLLLVGGAYLIWNRSKKGKTATLQAKKKSGGALGGGGGGGSSASPSGVSDTLIAGLDDGTDININVETDEGDINSGSGGLGDTGIPDAEPQPDTLLQKGNGSQANGHISDDSNTETEVDTSTADVVSDNIDLSPDVSVMPTDTETATTTTTSPTTPVAQIKQPQPVAQAGFVGFVDFGGDEDDLDIDY